MLRKNSLTVLMMSLVLLSLFSAFFIADVQAAPNDATLSDLSIDGFTVDGFASDVFSYDITVGNGTTQVDIAAVVADANASISGDTGTQNLSVGLNTFTITCQSEDLSATNDYVINVTREASDNAFLSQLNIDDELVSGFASDAYSYNINVGFTTDHVEISAVAYFADAAVSGDVGLQVLQAGLNTLTITCTAQDGVTTHDYVLNITRQSSSATAFSDIGFVPVDTAMDPDRDVAYLTAQNGYSLYRADLSTGNISYLTFGNVIQCFTLRNGNVYIALSSGSSGAISIVQTSTFTISKSFNIGFNPYDAEADTQGNVYVTANSTDRDAEMVSYDSSTGSVLSSVSGVHYYHMLDYNPVDNKVYSLCRGLTPTDFNAYEISSGIITSSYDSPYHGDYDFTRDIHLSTDGEYIFNESGYVLTCAPTQAGDMIYFDKIDSFSSICFDIGRNAFYTSKDNVVLTYNYSGRYVTNQFNAKDDFVEIFRGSQIVYLQKNTSGDYFFTYTPEASTSVTNVTGITLEKDSTHIRVGDNEQLMYDITPSDATNQHVLFTSSNELVATVDIADGTVTGVSEGACDITVTTLDGSFTDTCTVNVITTPEIGTFASGNNGLSDLGFVPYDTAIDPDRNVAYLTEENGNRLYRVDLTTGEVTYKEYVFQAESLIVGNGNIYLSLLHQPHNYFLSGEGTGTIVVIDTSTFVLVNSFDIEVDPFDIEVDNSGIIYIGPGSGQWSVATSYNTGTGDLIDSIASVNDRNLWDYNPVYNKLYSVTTDSNPSTMDGFELSAGMFTAKYDSPYHGDYSLGRVFSISPDGQSIFFGSGNIFDCAPTQAGDMVYQDNIDVFYSICFDLARNVFYTAKENVLLTYNYNTRIVQQQFTAEDDFIEIFYSSNQNIYMQKNASNEYYFALNPQESASIVDVSGVSLSVNSQYMMPGDTAIIEETISPSNATNQHIYWSSSNPAVASVEDGVITANSVGTCDITVTTLDGGFTDICTVNVVSSPLLGTYTTSINGFSNLGFEPFSVEVDSDTNYAYLTSKDDNRLYRVNLSTGEVVYLDFIYKTKHISLDNGNIYLALSYIETDNENEGGILATIDTASFTQTDFFYLESYPYDVLVDNSGYIYISPQSGYNDVLACHDLSTGDLVSSYNNIYPGSLMNYNEQHDKIYIAKTYGSPDKMYAYELGEGSVAAYYGWPSDYYKITSYQMISPDGQYAYNGSGNIFNCAPTQTGDMVYDGSIEAFDSFCFDLANNNFYTAKENVLKVHAYDTRTIVKEYTDENEFVDIFYWTDKIVALKTNDASNYYFDTTTGTGINVTSVTIDDVQINIGDTPDLNTAISPSDATNKTVSYSSSDESVATVNASGTVTAHAAGTATITVTTEDKGLADTCTVEVAHPVTGVELDNEAESVVTGVTGYTLQLNHTVLPVGAGNQNVTFTSSNEAVATVDNTGLVTAVDDGNVTITVETEEGSFTDSCTVDVEISLVKGTYASAANGLTNLGFVPNESIVSADGNYAYITEVDGYKLYRVNLSTGQVDYMEFIYKTQAIDMKDGKVYVALLHREHTIVRDTEISGTIAVIDEPSFSLISHFDVNTDPWDIELDDYGHIYVSPGSGHRSNFSSYNASTGQWIFTRDDALEKCNMTYSMLDNKFYNQSASGISAWTLENGTVNSRYDWEFGLEHAPAECTEISPDYNYLFNGSGGIYTSSYEQSEDMLFVARIDPFSSLCFNLNDNVFYTVSGNTLTAYDYYTREAVNTHTATDEFIEVYYENNNLISLNKNASDEYYFGFNTQSSAQGHKVAILFGISSYDTPTSSLNGPNNDMRALQEVLEYSGYHVYRYYSPTGAELINHSYFAASNMAPNNTLLFAYSGHGANGGYLIGRDNTAISINNLESALSMHTGIKEVIIDACFSGDFIAKDMDSSIVQSKDASKSFNDYVIEAFGKESSMMAARSLDQSGYYVITASSGDQLSYEYLFNLRNSPFAMENLYAKTINGAKYHWMGYFSAAFDDGFGLFNEVPLSKVWADANEDNVLTWNEIYTYAAAVTDDAQQVQVYPENSDHVLCNISNVLVTGVTVDDAQIDVGGTQQLNVTIAPADATYQKVIYLSSDENIVTVDSDGMVTGVAFGTATITVTTIDGGFTNTCTVTSGKHVESITISPETLDMVVNDTHVLTTTITPNNATYQTVTYTSSDESVATVDAIGMVWTHSTGTATITATTQDGGFTDTCEVTVIVPAASVEFSRETCYLEVNGTAELHALVLPLDATNLNVTFTSSDEAVATVALVDGAYVVTAHALGTADITVTTEDGGHTDICSVTVSDELIISSTFTVDRVYTYLAGMAIGTTVEDIVLGIDNIGVEIVILDANGEQVTGVPVSTGFTVRMIKDGEIVDELIIIIEGDVSPNGALDIIDYTLTRLHILNIRHLEGVALDTADVNNDGLINILDYTLIRLHILEIRSLYE